MVQGEKVNYYGFIWDIVNVNKKTDKATISNGTNLIKVDVHEFSWMMEWKTWCQR